MNKAADKEKTTKPKTKRSNETDEKVEKKAKKEPKEPERSAENEKSDETQKRPSEEGKEPCSKPKRLRNCDDPRFHKKPGTESEKDEKAEKAAKASRKSMLCQKQGVERWTFEGRSFEESP